MWEVSSKARSKIQVQVTTGLYFEREDFLFFKAVD